MNDILQSADQKRQRAYSILENLNLISLWKSVGQPVVVGAVRYGLVSSLDIDMEIYADEPTIQAGFDVMSKVAQHPGVRQVLFANELAGPDQGIYWQIQYCDELGELWKLDNWLVSHRHPDAHWCERFGDALAKVLTDEPRRTILQIKQAAKNAKTTLRGIDVYRAVLEGKVTTLDECQIWLGQNPAEGMCHWLPSA